MTIINREYEGERFIYNGELNKSNGGYPQLNIGFSIQEHAEQQPTLLTIYELKYNNFDASIDF